MGDDEILIASYCYIVDFEVSIHHYIRNWKSVSSHRDRPYSSAYVQSDSWSSVCTPIMAIPVERYDKKVPLT
jgi:hypothetical protein